ncbi:glycosyl hydrolase [Acetobacter orientalis]|uniref:Glycosyl hydrolase n=1 Tax=Acetobacter orientalis TaxID=146474 RepID=A0A2Z5ZJH2_9PROT|nr:glycosyl hydrolase [Acetobacter orientalis]
MGLGQRSIVRLHGQQYASFCPLWFLSLVYIMACHMGRSERKPPYGCVYLKTGFW